MIKFLHVSAVTQTVLGGLGMHLAVANFLQFMYGKIMKID